MGNLTGILTGLYAEARLLRGCPLVACAGAEPETATRALLAAGATRLLSFGLAGGLDPALAPGTLILASEIIADGARWSTDQGWAASLALPLAVRAPVLGTTAPLTDRAAKAAAFARTGAVAVDMESGAMAAVAAAAGVPLLALRAVADPAGQAVPAAALRCMDERGRLHLRAALAALALHPWTMTMLAFQAYRGMAALRTVTHRVGAL